MHLIKMEYLKILSKFVDQTKPQGFAGNQSLKGVLIESNYIVACDGHCLGCFKGPTGVKENMLLDVIKLLKTNPNIKNNLFLTIMDNKFYGVDKDGLRSCETLGNVSDYILNEIYPDWKKTIPDKSKIDLTVTACFDPEYMDRFNFRSNKETVLLPTDKDGVIFVLKPTVLDFMGVLMPMRIKDFHVDNFNYWQE